MAVPTDRAVLQSRWQTLFARQGVDPALSLAIFNDLAGRYEEPHRAYHNLRHLRHVLETIDSLKNQASDVTSIELAAWFHDVIYDPRGRDNEEQSAVYAEHMLRPLEMLDDLILRVKDLILLTKTHAAPPGDTDAAILLDADLAILGAPDAEYRQYAKAIRQEYAHVNDDDFRQGRRSVLELFLNRKRLFLTEPMFKQVEPRARENLRRELATLASGGL
jgi:predicted metal-dependent HD superfamily phosphohydrolase